METLPFILVIISIFSHAYWNFLIKRSQNKHVFTGLSKLAEIVIFGIPAIYYLWREGYTLEFASLAAVAACITFANYFFLSKAYEYGDLSLVYPISRSSILFLPILAYLLIDERIGFIGWSSVLLILFGTLTMHFGQDQRFSKQIISKGTLYAVLAALTVAGYTIWDKRSVTYMHPFLYFYSYTFLVAVFYNAFNFSYFKLKDIKTEWTLNKSGIVQVGFFNSFTYLLILTALSMSKTSYVGGLRQLSIVVGLFFGIRFLDERMTWQKVAGILLSLIGALLIYWAE